MASYGSKYEFYFESQAGANILIVISEKDYGGVPIRRPLGRAPILKRENNDYIYGSSLELYAECAVDGEYAQFYTSSADQFKVEVYKDDSPMWVGYIVPELYSEPDIAPPYDVQIIATDGLGELKNYVFESSGTDTLYNHIRTILDRLDLSTTYGLVSALKYMDNGAAYGAADIFNVRINLDHENGNTCYEVLQHLLSALNASITLYNGQWLIFRETDFIHLASGNNVSGVYRNGQTRNYPVVSFGSMSESDWWPVGNLSSVIKPAKNRIALTSENHYKENALDSTSWLMSNAVLDAQQAAYILSSAGSYIRQTINFGGVEIGYRLALRISARNVGEGTDPQNLGVIVKAATRGYTGRKTLWLVKSDDSSRRPSGAYTWQSVEGVIQEELEAPYKSDTASDAKDIDIVIPLYDGDGRSYLYATELEITLSNESGLYDINIHDISLVKYDQLKGYKADVVISNGAREEADEVDLGVVYASEAPSAGSVFMTGLPLLPATDDIITQWKVAEFAEKDYLTTMAEDHARAVALPRMRYQGILNVPGRTLPLLFLRDGTYYFPESYSYNLRNDELSVDMISIPSAQVTVQSVVISELSETQGEISSGSSGGGMSPGTGGGGSVVVDPFLSDTSSNPAESKAIKAYVDAADKALSDRITEIEENGAGGGGAVDSAMSDTSENAVQNKVIKKYVDDAAVYLEGYVEEQVNALEASVNQTFGDVETSIEQLDGAVSELFASKAGAFYVEPSTNLFIVFTTEEKKAAYIANGDTSGMLGKFALGGGGGTSQTYYDMAVVGLEKNYNYTTTSEKMIISAGFESRIMKAGSSTYEPYEEDAVFSVDILKGGAWKPVMSQMVSNGSTFSADLKPYVANGDNIIRVTATGLISSASGVASATLSVTTMSLAPFGFQWYTPFVEGQSYELGGLKILGTLNKRLHIKVTGNGYSKEYVESIGTQQYDIAPYSFRNLVHPSATGIYKVEMWLEAVASGVKSDTLTYNIMCVAQSAVGTAKLVCLNEVATEADNYAESKLFAYAIYNGGSASGSPTITLKKGSTTIASSSLNVDAGVPHDYSYAFALAMTETSANITATATFGNTQTATIALKNETSFAPVGGYSFYMDAATRSNGEAYRNYIVNEANGSRILASWTDMAWVDGMDGWTTDKDGNKCLLLPAMSKAYVDYAPMANKNTMTLELFYKVQNAADFDEDIITIASNVASSWMGVKVKPTNVTLHSQSLYQNDLMQGYNTKDEEMVHLVITIIGNYDGIGSIAMIYVNGGKRCSFEWSTGDTFAHNGTLVLGSDTADLYVYKMRVYDSQFLWPQVLQNYISCQHTAAERSQIKRREDSVLNDSNGLDYDKIVGKQNTFVIELPKGAELPNRLNNPSNDPIEGCNIYIDIVQDRQCSVQGHWLLVPIDGQGTTGMTYFRWNLRSKTATIRITAKKDVASSSHSHKRGGTGLYNDLYQRIVGHNEVNGRMAVYQYPVYGYLKVENEDAPGTYHYEFIGLYTIGPDKGDKSTFGFDNAEYKDTLIHMEGTDHSPAGVGYDYPWEQMTVGLNEKGDAFLGAKNTSGGLAQEAWEIGACGGKKTASDIKTYLDAEYAPAYKLDYECTPMISGLASGQTIYSVNTDVTNFRKQTSYENFTKADCIIFDADYNTYYYNVNSQSYVADGRKVYDGLTSSHGFSLSTLNSKGSVSAKEQYIRECRAKRHRAEVGNYWLLRDSLFHACFLDLIGATDNEKKNTYPLKFGTLASGSRWRHRQDDLDTMADINNQGSADKKYSIMNTDSKDGVMVYKGNSSYHWRCIREYYKDDMKSMMREIFDNMKSLSPYGTSDIQKLVGCIRHYFWDYAQEYFTRGAYNIDAKWTYEDTWRLYKSDKTINAVHPLQQSLGSHYEAEVAWMTLRMLFLASMNEWGAFVHYSDSSEGQVSFRQGRDFTFKLTPAIDMRPSVVIGSDSDKKFANGRVMAGNTASILVAASGDGDTMAYIQGADWLQDIGDFSTLKLGSTSRSLAVTSKRLQKLKVGDAIASKVTTNITGLDLGSCPSLAEIDARNVTALAGEVDLTNCPRLRIARFGGTSASVIKLPDGSKIETFDLPSSLMRLTLRKLPLLRKSGLTYDALNNLTYLWVQDNKNLDGYDMLKSAWEGNSPLKNIRVIGFTKTADDDDTTFLLGLAEGEHYGIDEQGNVNDNINPVVQGTLNYDVIDGEAYDALKASYGDVLVINYNKIIAFIKFANSNVLAKLLANGIGSDGGVTKAQAAAVTTLPSFYNDQAIDSFDELQYFTSVTQIGPSGSTNGGFLKAINLKSIVLPPSVKTIGFAAFQETAISSINLDNVTKFLERAFQLCSNLGIVNAPSLEDIGATAFASSGITEIVSLGKVTTLKSSNSSKGTFAGCKKLVKANLTGITVFGLYEFNQCTSLAEVIIDWSKVTSIGQNTFNNCTQLVIDNLNLSNLESFGQNAFYGVKVKSITSMGGLTSLPAATGGQQNYGSNAYLEYCCLPDGVANIPQRSFQGYSVLRTLVIGSGCTSIEGYIVNNCKSLATIVCKATTPPALDSNAWYGATAISSYYVPDASVDAYKAATNWSNVASKIKPLSEYNG